MKIGYQLKQVRERLAKGLVDKGILRTEKRNFLLFDMATHPIADNGGAKDEIRRRVRTLLTQRTVVLQPSPLLPAEMEFRYLRTVAMVCAAYAANVLENALSSLGHEARERAFAVTDELLAEFSQFPFARRGGGSQGVAANLGQAVGDECNRAGDRELQLEVSVGQRVWRHSSANLSCVVGHRCLLKRFHQARLFTVTIATKSQLTFLIYKSSVRPIRAGTALGCSRRSIFRPSWHIKRRFVERRQLRSRASHPPSPRNANKALLKARRIGKVVVRPLGKENHALSDDHYRGEIYVWAFKLPDRSRFIDDGSIGRRALYIRLGQRFRTRGSPSKEPR